MDEHFALEAQLIALTDRELIRTRGELVARLREMEHSYAITLGTNHRPLSTGAMRDVLKSWDARENRILNGPRWAKRPDERIMWIAFPEKQEVNPHWHLLASPDPTGFHDHRAQRYHAFQRSAERTWLRLLPTGTAQCVPLRGENWEFYITKELAKSDRIEHFILSREFQSI